MHALWQDLRYGLRLLAKNPGFTLIAVLTLALGIGANTAIFSILNQVLLRKLPVRNPERLVVLKSPGPKSGRVWSDGDDSEIFSYPIYKGLAKNTSVFDGVFARYQFPASFADRGQTDRASGELVSGNYFETLGVRPALGRLFTPDDDVTPGAHPVVVLSYGYWKQRYGSDPSVLNRAVLINNTELTIVGVAQAGFTGVQVGQTPDIFVPLMMKGQMTPLRSGLDDWNDYWLAVLARLKPGVSIRQAEAAINTEYRPMMEQQITTLKHNLDTKERGAYLNKKIFLSSGAQGRLIVQRDMGPAIKAMFAMVVLVLLIACTNVANLLLAQGAARQREFSIRTAMGATRGRLTRQVMAESFLCAIAGGGLGLFLASWLTQVLSRVVVSEAGILGVNPQIDGKILGFAVGVTLLSGLLFGLLPAWRVARSAVTQTLKDQGTGSSSGLAHVRFRKVLVAGQVAFTLLLVAGAALFSQTLWNLQKQNLGVQTENLITFSIQPPLNGYNRERTIALIDQLREHLAALPGVSSVGSSELPVLTGDDMGGNITVEGRQSQDEDDHINFDYVSPKYFSAMGVPLVAGREFAESDGPNTPKVAVISEALAKQCFPGRNPLGMHFALGGGSKVKPDIEVVGVVKNEKLAHVRDKDRPFFFLPYSQVDGLFAMSFYVRTQQDPMVLSNELRQVVRDQDANLPVYDLKTLSQVVDDDLFSERTISMLSTAFGGLAALLAMLGIYGVLAYLVVQRTREIGIRLALGAETGNIRGLVFKEVFWMVLAGGIVGLPLSYGLAKLSQSLLFGVQPNNATVYLAAAALIVVVAGIACYVPARRAARVDPIVALRYE